ncbi:MAG: Lhr-like helicases [uncultured Thiotrichaceae bacterium]|uniref:Lhr-like helicases n=1 Tax=uncultured Thiotrichaceae bacterium TaxID=298394 RepID=A0A6S6U5N5_9GAMM|nr:MAG: Lhr-like helicases [uncultured Thiotrichaceae bacterium]
MILDDFHPAVRRWFKQHFSSPTEVQLQAWQSIMAGQHALLAAPTGSGKTLAAFLATIDRLLKEGLAKGLPAQTRVLYISPLKALSNDIQINLQEPIQGIRDALLEQGTDDLEIRAWVRTGDTPQSERQKAIKTPPHILVTTPESVYILLTSESGRKILSTIETVIVDEIHALAGNKRGAHLTLSLERLQALVKQHHPKRELQRIGISATQKPIEDMAYFLIGQRDAKCKIIDTGHARERDLDILLPQSPLDAVMANEVWTEIYNALAHLVQAHSTTLIFVNTRRLAERATRHLAERMGEEHVMAHHGSMSKERRHKAEKRLKSGDLQCLVATASLELGIDIGDIDLVCQLGSPRSIAAFLQRVGRSGHAVGATPKGRLFPLSRDELVETTALMHAAQQGELDRIIIPQQPLDVLAQQIVAEVSGQDWDVDALYKAFHRAWPYRDLSLDTFDQVVTMLAEGYSTRRGRRGAYLHLDAINRKVRARRNARLVAITNGGAIPDQFDCDVILQPEGFRIGTIGEDFAFESIPGDIFQLGNRSYRMLKSETGRVFVEDAQGQPPNIPFWFGEAPGRTDELSQAVSRLREQLSTQLPKGLEASKQWAMQHYGIRENAAIQLVDYLATAHAAMGCLPTQENIVLERFFDEVGDMHLVVHSPYGSRLNRAWGLSLRKRFCRKFNFELQAAALEDTIVLSLSSTHSFPLEEVAKYLNSKSVREVLVQALLDAPMFPTRWRWNATTALAVQRFRAGKKNSPYFQRSDAEDLVAVLFPDQIACGENIAGDREVPDHPLVQQSIHDCLYETMDIEGLEQLLQRLEQRKIKITSCDLTAPSPLAAEVLNARPYAFLDDGDAEERRTLAVKTQGHITLADAANLSQLDPEAIAKVKQEAWPRVRDADELHDALMILGFISEKEAQRGNQLDLLDIGWNGLFQPLLNNGRAIQIRSKHSATLWVAMERIHDFQVLFGQFETLTRTHLPKTQIKQSKSVDDALLDIIRSRLEGVGPITVQQLAEPLGLSTQKIDIALLALEQEGFIIRGKFTNPQSTETEWCERRLLARIHRYTLNRLRSEINPVNIGDYLRFLFDWQGLTEKREGVEALAVVLEQLEGYPIAAATWEQDILKSRITFYTSDMLDTLSLTGRISWLRLAIQKSDKQKRSPVSQSPITLINRQHLDIWRALNPLTESITLSANAKRAKDTLSASGAMFFDDIVKQSGLLRTQVEEALGELVNWGLVTSDSFAGLRALVKPLAKRSRLAPRRGRRGITVSPFDNAGRWSLLENVGETNDHKETDLEFLAFTLLNRYGVVFRKVLDREVGLPPWRDLLRVYWRLEARGEIRGGRFVESVSGEQFALPDAIGSLRRISKQDRSGECIIISSADPLNLQGHLMSGEKIPISAKTRIVYQDGNVVATVGKDGVEFLTELSPEQKQTIRSRLFL